MEKDTRTVLLAVLILLVSMFSLNLNSIMGRVISNSLPDLRGEAYFADLSTGEKITQANVGDKVDIIVVVKNVGDGNAPPGGLGNNVKYRLEVKQDGVKVQERGLKKTFDLEGLLKPQDITKKHLSYISPQYRYFQFNSPGEYCLDFKIDTTKKLAESNEDNEFKDEGCATVVNEGEPLPQPEEASDKPEKKVKVKKYAPALITLKLLGSYEGDKLLDLGEETCELEGRNKAVSCSFEAELEIGNNYVVRGSVSDRIWEVRFVRIIDSSNKEFLRKVCGRPFCELKTEDFLKTETKLDQNIKTGKYLIEGSAELA